MCHDDVIQQLWKEKHAQPTKTLDTKQDRQDDFKHSNTSSSKTAYITLYTEKHPLCFMK